MSGNPYESERYLNEYLLLHYGQARDLCPFRFIPRETLRFHQRIVEECVLPLGFTGETRGLDIGCAVGRFTFELGRVVDRVLGIDSSRQLIRAARHMAQTRTIIARVGESGAKIQSLRLALPKVLRPASVKFRVANALDLSTLPDAPYHVVAAINVICRLPEPRKFLTELHDLVVPRGQLVVASPYSWLEEYTPRREWLNPEEVESILRPRFRLARRRDLPFLIREHRRKYQLVVSEVSVFARRSA